MTATAGPAMTATVAWLDPLLADWPSIGRQMVLTDEQRHREAVLRSRMAVEHYRVAGLPDSRTACRYIVHVTANLRAQVEAGSGDAAEYVRALAAHLRWMSHQAVGARWAQPMPPQPTRSSHEHGHSGA